MIALCEDGCSSRCCWVLTNFGLFFFQLSDIVIADIDEGTVTPHPNAEIPRLPSFAVSLYKFRYSTSLLKHPILRILHFNWNSPSPHCSRSAEIFRFRLIRIHSLTPEIPYHYESSIKIILKRKRGGKVTPNLTVGLTTCDLFSNIFRNKRSRWLIFAW